MNQVLEEVRIALYSVWNRRWLALAAAWGVCLLGWAAIAFIPNSYESESRIFVQLDDALAQQIGIGAGNREKDIERVRQTLTSAINLEKVVRSTRIGEDVTTPRQLEIAIEDLGKNIEVRSDEDSLFEITATSGRGDLSDSENAVLAQDIVQKMIDIFREENLTGGRGEMRESIDFLNQQLADRQQELEEAEQRRLAFEAQNPELIGGPATVGARLASTRSELRSVEADLTAAQSALAAIRGQLSSTPRTIAGTAEQGGPRASLAQAQAQMASLRGRGLTDSHPDVIAINRQIELLRPQAAAQGGAGSSPNPAYSSLLSINAERQASVTSLQARKAALSTEVTQAMASQAQEPGVAAEATRISRDYEVLRDQYDKLLQDREELKLRGQVETERSAIKFEVIDPPTSPRVPDAPNRPLLLAAVLALGIGAGSGAAFLKGQIGSGFQTASGLEKALELPVIGTVSTSMTPSSRIVARKRMRQFAMASGGLAGLFIILVGAEFVQRGMVA